LPELVEARRGGTLTLTWKTPHDLPFPMPIEIEVDGKVERLAMTDGKDTLSVSPSAHVVIDPMARVLRRSIAIEQAQAWHDAQAARKGSK
jgi:hypothetical protein